MPPASIKYHVRSKIVVSETRLEQLRAQVLADRAAVKAGELKRIQLLSVKVLDLADQESSVELAAPQEKVVLVEVGTLWASRCTTEKHYTWLKNISKSDRPKLGDASVAAAARFARWELFAAQHYHQQHAFLASKAPLLDSPATHSDRPVFSLASFSKPASGPTAETAEIISGNADFGLQLSDQIERAAERVNESEQAWETDVEQSSGVLQIASVPVVAPRSTSIPYWMAASVIVLGLSAGSTAGWFQHRRQSGGTYYASAIAEQLATDGIPTVGSVKLPEEEDTVASSLSGFRAATAGRRLTKLSEYAVTFWAILASCRFFLDSSWRDVLVDSPLAALGRLMSGMP